MTEGSVAPTSVVPASISEATAALAAVAAAGQRAVVVGGGTILVPRLTRGEVRPTHVVDLGRLGQNQITRERDVVHLGAMTSYQQLIESDVVARELPLLQLMAKGITGGVQIRTQGTIGGSVVLARPFSDIPTVMVCLGASVTIAWEAGAKTVRLEDFVLDAERVALSSVEILTQLSVPARPDASYGYEKLKFAESSWPVLTAAALLEPHGTVSIALGGLARVPRIVRLAANDVVPSLSDVRDALEEGVTSVALDDLWQDVRAGSDYRRRVAATVGARAYRRALDHHQARRGV